MPDRFKRVLSGIGRLFMYAIVTATVTVALAFAFSSASNKQAFNLLRDIRNASRAQACVLALPVGEKGRDSELVVKCFEDNGITPPDLAPPREAP